MELVYVCVKWNKPSEILEMILKRVLLKYSRKNNSLDR